MARALALVEHPVQLFDKACGPGGRLPAVGRQAGGWFRLVQRLREEVVNTLAGREVPR